MSESAAVLCNSGPLITLGKLNRLDLLANLFQEVQIPQAVYAEVVTAGMARGAPDALVVRLFWKQQSWPVVSVAREILEVIHPEVILDPGEMEVLLLARTLPDPLVLLDDEVARMEARRLQLRVRGTLGILVQAYRHQILSLAQVELLLQEISARSDIWISEKLCVQVLTQLERPAEL